jgi:capsular polysaccharide biosynthesis protein
VSSRSSVFDSKVPVNVELVHLPVAALKKLRDRVIECQKPDTGYSGPDAFYLKRNSVLRGILNAESVEAVVSELGIDTLESDANFFKFQIPAFHQAILTIIPGGASVANILFMKPGTKVLILKSWRNRKLNLWQSLAIGLGLEYKEINGVPNYFGLKYLRRMHSDYWIPPRKLKRELSKFRTSRT